MKVTGWKVSSRLEETEIVFSFESNSSYLRQAPEGNVPVCRILTAGSTPTAVTRGAEDRAPLKYEIAQYLV